MTVKKTWSERSVKLLQNELLWLLLGCWLFRFFFQRSINYIAYDTDSVTYFYAAKNLFEGLIDPFRTPVYPAIIALFKITFDKDPFPAVVFFQGLISLISIVPFYYCCKLWLSNKYLIIGATLIYGCFPAILYYNNAIFPESLLISSFTGLLYLFATYFIRPTNGKAIGLNTYIFFLVLLKPGCIYLYGVLGVIWLVKLIIKNERAALAYPLLSFFASIFLVLSYCSINKIQNDYFGISMVTHDNNLANVINSQAYKEIPDPKIVSIVDTTLRHGIYYTIYYLNNDHDIIQKQYDAFPYERNQNMDYVSGIPPCPIKYTKKQLDLFISQAMCSRVFTLYICNNFLSFIDTEVFYLKGYVLYALFLAELIAIGCFYVLRKQILWFKLTVLIVIAGMLFTFFLAGFGQVDRILVPIISFLLVFISGFIDAMIYCFDNSKVIPYLSR
jgi:hypothetical protein